MGPWIILMVIKFFLSRYGAIYQYEKDGIEAAGDVDKGLNCFFLKQLIFTYT